MDHSHMDHSHHDHSHMEHSNMNLDSASPMAGDRCSMSMLFTWNTENLCIVFRQWHIRSTTGLILSLLAIVAIGIGYEALRAASRRYEAAVQKKVDSAPRRNQAEISKQAHVIKAVLYATQNFYAFMLMLVFMTYNGWVMIAVSLGAFIGYLLFGKATSSTKDNACH